MRRVKKKTGVKRQRLEIEKGTKREEQKEEWKEAWEHGEGFW